MKRRRRTTTPICWSRPGASRGDHLSAKKARDLDPEVKRLGARNAVTDGEQWGALWRDHQDRYFAEHGLELRGGRYGRRSRPARRGRCGCGRRSRRPCSAPRRSRGRMRRRRAIRTRCWRVLNPQQRDVHRARAGPPSRQAHPRRGRASGREGEGCSATPRRSLCTTATAAS